MTNQFKTADDDGDMGLPPGAPPEEFFISTRKSEAIVLDITLSTNIVFSFQYEKLFAQLRNLPANCQQVNLFLANYGGYLQGLVPLYNAFRYCSVPVNVIVTGECYSAGAMLALCGDSLTMFPNTMLMFHNSSGGEFGKGKELFDAVMHSNKHTRELFKNMLSPFLTKEEIDDIANDKDVYVHWNSKGLATRMKRHFGKRK